MSTSADGRDGTSVEKALIVGSIDEEYRWLWAHYPGCETQEQRLESRGDRPFDVVTIRTRQGAEVEVYFDVSRLFGHPDQ